MLHPHQTFRWLRTLEGQGPEQPSQNGGPLRVQLPVGAGAHHRAAGARDRHHEVLREKSETAGIISH